MPPPLGWKFVVLTALCGGLGCGGGRASGPEAGPEAAAFFPRVDGGRPICSEVTRPLTFEPRVADVLVLFDRSGSMGTEFGGGTRYSVESDLVGDFVETYQDKIRFGLQIFPARRACAAGQAAGCCVDRPAVGVAFDSAEAIRDGM